LFISVQTLELDLLQPRFAILESSLIHITLHPLLTNLIHQFIHKQQEKAFFALKQLKSKAD